MNKKITVKRLIGQGIIAGIFTLLLGVSFGLIFPEFDIMNYYWIWRTLFWSLLTFGGYSISWLIFRVRDKMGKNKKTAFLIWQSVAVSGGFTVLFHTIFYASISDTVDSPFIISMCSIWAIISFLLEIIEKQNDTNNVRKKEKKIKKKNRK